MKAITFFLITILSYTLASQEVDVRASVYEVKPKINQWLFITTSSEKTIEQVVVQKPITADDELSIEYNITNKDDKVLGQGSGPFCSNPASKDGIIVSLLSQFLGINLECPVEQKQVEKPPNIVSGKIVVDENPGKHKIFIEMSIKKGTASLITVSVSGRASDLQ
ncbi:uncharacterized protein [Fopius arisanus]|uniref:Uncharacterized protein n=1 Tax=Fopius arisanus TaxID=64838 RepID=A0A9R1T3P7_9HYME|nr:PREDICTED: uncharacterized protein LOC105266058 [Fopius arisanus]